MATTRQKILVVDDLVENIRILSRILESEGEIVFARNGKEAIKQVAAANPDLILLDIGLPDIDGFDVIARLKADPRCDGVPIIVATGRDDEFTEERALTAGAVDYVLKPFRPTVIRARARTHLNIRAQTRQFVAIKEKLEQLATIDPLTNIMNRRAFIERGEAELGRMDRHGGCATILALNIDRFKSINDLHGHAGGDAALADFADCVKHQIREHDLFGRMGGDEFAILLPQTEIPGAESFAARIMAAVANRPHKADGPHIEFTISVGLATIHPKERDLIAALKRADDALCISKAQARKRQTASSD